jgi:hypothetical protein
MMAVDEIRAREARQLEEVKADRERMRDALEHIASVCEGSRTSTRRLRWIALRCRCAIDGNEEWRVADLPVVDPLVDKLREILKEIFPFVSRELVFTIDNYSTLSSGEREGASFEELLESINERDVHDEVVRMRRFLIDTRRNVPEINIEELRKGGDWIELN